jgi:phage-related protein
MPQTVIRAFRDADGTIPLLEWLDDLEESEPRVFAKCLAFVLLLSQLGYELRRPHADTLKDGVHELRLKVGTVNYRILYFFMGPNIACLSQGLTKESTIPKAEIDLAVKRKRLVESDPDKYTAVWEG